MLLHLQYQTQYYTVSKLLHSTRQMGSTTVQMKLKQ